MQVLGNILLLLPVPIFMKLQNTKKTYSNKKLFLVGLALSFAIEVIQFCINILTGVTEKISDIDDLLLNLCGVLVGIILAKYAIKIKKILMKKESVNEIKKNNVGFVFLYYFHVDVYHSICSNKKSK